MRARTSLVLLLAALASLVFEAAGAAQTRPGCPAGKLAGGASPGALAACREQSARPIEVLLFSRTAGFRHASIADAWRTLGSLPAAENVRVTPTEDPSVFTDEALAGFDVVLFVNTTGDVLDEAQQAALERFVRSGKGWVGVHSAADTEYGWPWYGRLVGASKERATCSAS